MKYLPMVGIAVFIALYFWAALLYPGGSPFDPSTAGFSFKHNFWCHLLYEDAFNGQANVSRPVAISGMLVLCLSILSFFLLFPKYFKASLRMNLFIRLNAIICIGCCFFISSKAHDLFTTLACIAGALSLIGVVLVLKSRQLTYLVLIGVLGLLLMMLNIYMYFSGVGFEWLPVIQKITFLTVLGWMVLTNLQFRNS